MDCSVILPETVVLRLNILEPRHRVWEHRVQGKSVRLFWVTMETYLWLGRQFSGRTFVNIHKVLRLVSSIWGINNKNLITKCYSCPHNDYFYLFWFFQVIYAYIIYISIYNIRTTNKRKHICLLRLA